MWASVQDVFKPLYARPLAVLDPQGLLLAVSVKKQRLVCLFADHVLFCLRQLLFREETVDIQGRFPGAEALRPFRPREIRARRARHVYVRLHPFQKFIGRRGQGRGQPILAHQPRRVDHQNAVVFQHRAHTVDVLQIGLELLLGNDPQPPHNALNGQGVVKGVADDEGHRPMRCAYQRGKIKRGLVVGDHYERPAFSLDLVAQDARAEAKTGRDPTGKLRHAIQKHIRFFDLHTPVLLSKSNSISIIAPVCCFVNNF